MEDAFRLEGQNAIVIGSNREQCERIARMLASWGAEVSIASPHIDHLMIAKENIETAVGGNISVYTVDASNEESIRTLVDTVVRDRGPVDILVDAQSGRKKGLPMAVMEKMFPVEVIGIAMRAGQSSKHHQEAGT